MVTDLHSPLWLILVVFSHFGLLDGHFFCDEARAACCTCTSHVESEITVPQPPSGLPSFAVRTTESWGEHVYKTTHSVLMHCESESCLQLVLMMEGISV